MKNSSPSIHRCAWIIGASLTTLVTLSGYVLDTGPAGGAITLNPGSTTIAIRLGNTPVLSDGSNYSAEVLVAMAQWNAVLGRIHLLGDVQPPGGNQQEEDGINEIVFSANVYGQAYSPGVQAVTMGRRSGSPRADGTYRRVQADIFFNTAFNWDSYRGPRQQNPLDVRRVALHELGHVIGLLHPSEAGQNVAAVMNNNAAEPTLTADDIAGGQFLYGAPGSVNRPANNDFSAAALVGGAQATGSNVGATKESGEPNHVTGTFGGSSVWWRWVAPAGGSLTLTTEGSNFDTILGVYTGTTVNALTQLASNDDVTSGVVRTSAVTLNVTSGTTYFFAVDGWDSDAGNITLNVNFTAGGGSGAPAITGTLPNQAVTTGFNVAFTAGGTNGTVQWQVSTDGGANWTNLTNSATYSGATTRTLEISNATAALNNNRYRYVLTENGASANSNAATLTVMQAFLPFPVALAVDASGAIFVTDSANDTVHRIAGGQVATFAGTAGQAGSVDGTGAAARFNDPSGVAIDAGGGVVIADSANATIRRASAAGVVTTLAGSTTGRGNNDGVGAQATFSAPIGLVRDAAGIVFVADSTNHTIRRIAADGGVTTFAGAAGSTGSIDGSGGAARFNRPTGLAIDAAGNLFVADSTNNTIRRITPAGAVSTFAGVPGVAGTSDGAAHDALFNNPSGLAVDGSGNVFVADSGNSTIRMITAGGVVSTVAGLPGVAGLKDGAGNEVWFNQPRAIAIAGADLIVADTGNAVLRRITAGGNVATMALVAAANPTPTPTPTPPAPTPTPPSSGGGGGGGAPAIWCFGALLFALSLRRAGRGR